MTWWLFCCLEIVQFNLFYNALPKPNQTVLLPKPNPNQTVLLPNPNPNPNQTVLLPKPNKTATENK